MCMLSADEFERGFCPGDCTVCNMNEENQDQ